MILFIGDVVRLHESKQWLEVTDIEPHDICVLEDGDRVCASSEYIAEAKSNSQYATQVACEKKWAERFDNDTQDLY